MTMNLFTPELFRSFALGFALGSLFLGIYYFNIVGNTLAIALAPAGTMLQMTASGRRGLYMH